MVIRKILGLLAVIILCISCAGNRGLKVKNETMVPVNVIVRAKENRTTTSPMIISHVVNPGEEATVTLDQKDFKGITFSVQGTTVTGPGIVPLTTNECILSSSNAARVIFTPKYDGTVVCGVTQLAN